MSKIDTIKSTETLIVYTTTSWSLESRICVVPEFWELTTQEDVFACETEEELLKFVKPLVKQAKDLSNKRFFAEMEQKDLKTLSWKTITFWEFIDPGSKFAYLKSERTEKLNALLKEAKASSVQLARTGKLYKNPVELYTYFKKCTDNEWRNDNIVQAIKKASGKKWEKSFPTLKEVVLKELFSDFEAVDVLEFDGKTITVKDNGSGRMGLFFGKKGAHIKANETATNCRIKVI